MGDQRSPFQYVFGIARVAMWLDFGGPHSYTPGSGRTPALVHRLIQAIGVLIFGTFLLFGIPRWLGWIR
jgi:hypothetical protein